VKLQAQVTQADEASVVGEKVTILQQEKGEILLFRRMFLKYEQK
jgi:hypothetical protein